MTRESSKSIPPDHFLAFPIFHNPLFRIRKELQAEWNLHPQLPSTYQHFAHRNGKTPIARKYPTDNSRTGSKYNNKLKAKANNACAKYTKKNTNLV
eukprot:6180427-Pleurochrysis_carterae.AAC.2